MRAQPDFSHDPGCSAVSAALIFPDSSLSRVYRFSLFILRVDYWTIDGFEGNQHHEATRHVVTASDNDDAQTAAWPLGCCSLRPSGDGDAPRTVNRHVSQRLMSERRLADCHLAVGIWHLRYPRGPSVPGDQRSDMVLDVGVERRSVRPVVNSIEVEDR